MDENQSEKKPTPQGSGFHPHSGRLLDATFFYVLFEPLLKFIQPVMIVIYATRWELARPLQIRVFPSWFPFVDISGIKDLPFLTIGQVLLAIPLVILILSGYYFTFVAPDVETSGKVASYAIFATFLTANKSNSLTAFFLGIPFERMIPYHNLSSLTTVVLSLFHGYVAFAYGEGDRRKLESSEDTSSGDSQQYGLMGSNPNLLKFLFDGENNTSGSLLALAMFVLVLSSIFPIFRRNFFDFWLWIHILLACCVIIFCVMHEVTSILFVALWWLLDILMRYLIMAGCRYPHIASLELMADDIVKVSFVKPDGFQYNAGQFVQIAFPDLGLYAFHPISISSSPHESSVTLHVRGLGSWSNKLVELAQVKDEAPILIEGPYGSISVDLDSDDRYQIVVLISGGIGVTHTQSVAKSLLHEHRNGRKLRHLRFVWAIRDLKMLEAIEPLDEPISRFRDIELTETSKIQTNVVDLDKTAPEMPSLVQTDVFLTKASREMPITMDDGRNLYFGRPDIDVIISDVKEVAKRQGVTHVAVVVCGPKPLVDKVKNVCRQKSNVMSKVKFDVHQEIFDF